MNHWVLWCCDAVSFTVRSKSWDRQLWGLSVPLSCYKWTAWCNGDGERTHLHLYWSSQWALVSLRYFLCHSHWNTAARFTAQRVHFTFPKQLGERCWDRISAVFINKYIRIYWRQDRRRRDVCVCVCVLTLCFCRPSSWQGSCLFPFNNIKILFFFLCLCFFWELK